MFVAEGCGILEATGLGGGILEDGVNPDDSLGQPGGPLALQLTQVTGNSAGEGGGIFASTGSPVTLSLSQVLSNNPDNCAPPGHHPRLHRLAGSPRQPAGRHDRDGPPGISAETLVALTAATASMPGYRPSSPAAPRLSRARTGATRPGSPPARSPGIACRLGMTGREEDHRDADRHDSGTQPVVVVGAVPVDAPPPEQAHDDEHPAIGGVHPSEVGR